MHLHKNTEDFNDLIRITAENLGLDATIVEKDYWITHALYQLSKSEYNNQVVFKGGTSLTKCYEDLHRFSEDIDIALLASDMTDSQIKKTIARVEGVMSIGLQPGEFEEERKSGDYRYTQFTYESLFSGGLMELHPNIRFELTSFMHPHPYELRNVGSFIGQYLDKSGLQDIIKEFGLEPFELKVLSIERTVTEKLVTLIRMSYDVDLKELLTKTRHFYDLYMTYHLVREFYENDVKLTEMAAIVKLAETQSRFKEMYPVENPWHIAPLFRVLEDPRVEIAYKDRFGAEFVYGKLPAFEEVRIIIIEIQQALIRCNI